MTVRHARRCLFCAHRGDLTGKHLEPFSGEPTHQRALTTARYFDQPLIKEPPANSNRHVDVLAPSGSDIRDYTILVNKSLSLGGERLRCQVPRQLDATVVSVIAYAGLRTEVSARASPGQWWRGRGELVRCDEAGFPPV
jgi:hypothetical protein